MLQAELGNTKRKKKKKNSIPTLFVICSRQQRLFLFDGPTTLLEEICSSKLILPPLPAREENNCF